MMLSPKRASLALCASDPFICICARTYVSSYASVHPPVYLVSSASVRLFSLSSVYDLCLLYFLSLLPAVNA